MKLIIDIPYQLYKVLKDFKDFPSDSNETTIENVLMKAVENGTPIPDNATNGDVIKAVFPNLEIEYTDTDEYTNKPKYVKLIVGDTIITRMSADRWNAPYQKGGKE